MKYLDINESIIKGEAELELERAGYTMRAIVEGKEKAHSRANQFREWGFSVKIIHSSEDLYRIYTKKP